MNERCREQHYFLAEAPSPPTGILTCGHIFHMAVPHIAEEKDLQGHHIQRAVPLGSSIEIPDLSGLVKSWSRRISLLCQKSDSPANKTCMGRHINLEVTFALERQKDTSFPLLFIFSLFLLVFLFLLSFHVSIL